MPIAAVEIPPPAGDRPAIGPRRGSSSWQFTGRECAVRRLIALSWRSDRCLSVLPNSGAGRQRTNPKSVLRFLGFLKKWMFDSFDKTHKSPTNTFTAELKIGGLWGIPPNCPSLPESVSRASFRRRTRYWILGDTLLSEILSHISPSPLQVKVDEK